MRQEKGIALVGVLWVVLLLSFMAAGASWFMRTQRVAVGNHADAARARAIADGAVYAVIHELLSPKRTERVRVDGVAMMWPIAGRGVEASVEDEGGKVDLNAAPIDLIARLIATSGEDVDQARRIAEVIGAWRDGEPDHHANRSARRQPVGGGTITHLEVAKGFGSVDEIRQIPGMTFGLYERVKRFLTVYSMRAFVDPLTADEQVLRVLPSVSIESADAILESRQTNDKRVQSGWRAGAEAVGPVLAGRVFMIKARLQLANTVLARRSAVVRFTGDPKRPYLIHRWAD